MVVSDGVIGTNLVCQRLGGIDGVQGADDEVTRFRRRDGRADAL